MKSKSLKKKTDDVVSGAKSEGRRERPTFERNSRFYKTLHKNTVIKQHLCQENKTAIKLRFKTTDKKCDDEKLS